jgi:hypothetical protein
MRSCEYRIDKQLRANTSVFYSGQLIYGEGDNPIPQGIRMTAFTAEGKLFDVTVQNIAGKQSTC